MVVWWGRSEGGAFVVRRRWGCGSAQMERFIKERFSGGGEAREETQLLEGKPGVGRQGGRRWREVVRNYEAKVREC